MSKPDVAAVILAAGGSSRLGRPKQLLDWFGKPFITQVISLSKQAQLDPVIVVTGASHEAIEDAISGEKIVVVRNEDWQEGQSSSMKAGVKELNKRQVDSFVVFLCDQPQIPLELLDTMILESQQKDIDIVATSVNGKICPPTLFKKICIGGMKELKGDQGGRILFNSYRTKILNWKDERLLQDADTEEDYKKLINLYSN